MTKDIRLHILTGKETPSSPREFIFAHVELGRVEDEMDDNICDHVSLNISPTPYFLMDD